VRRILTGIKKDNSTLKRKVSLRKKLLKEIDNPIICETHGGKGQVWERCYKDFKTGVVFEKKEDKSAILAAQRPTWAVYESDCIIGMLGGIQDLFKINFLDIDPYGDPWPVIDAFFTGQKEKIKPLVIAVNDGLRLGVKMNIAWTYGSLKKYVEKYGNQSIYKNYVDICQEMLEEKASDHGYEMRLWAGYYCGKNKQMTHYGCVLN